MGKGRLVKPEIHSLLENTSALAMTFGQDKLYQQFYDRLGPSLNGFPGIWEFIAALGFAFDKKTKGVDWGDEAEWIDSIDMTIESVFNAALSRPEDVPLPNFSKEQHKWMLERVEVAWY